MSRPEPVEESSATEVVAGLLDAIRTVAGLRLASPVRQSTATRWLPFDPAVLAVDLSEDLAEIRVLATALPLPPLLKEADSACRAALAGTRWANATLRLIVVDVDAAAF